MNSSKLGRVLIVLAIVAVVGFAATSFAGWGMGYGHQGWGHPGPGWQRGGYGNPSYPSEFSDEEIAGLNEERQAFFNETSDLRETLYQKELELSSELAKKDPDAKKAVSLQKEISDLEGKLDQKRIEHRIQMRKANPNLTARGYGFGPGGMGMGRGFYGRGGGCWY